MSTPFELRLLLKSLVARVATSGSHIREGAAELGVFNEDVENALVEAGLLKEHIKKGKYSLPTSEWTNDAGLKPLGFAPGSFGQLHAAYGYRNLTVHSNVALPPTAQDLRNLAAAVVSDTERLVTGLQGHFAGFVEALYRRQQGDRGQRRGEDLLQAIRGLGSPAHDVARALLSAEGPAPEARGSDGRVRLDAAVRDLASRVDFARVSPALVKFAVNLSAQLGHPDPIEAWLSGVAVERDRVLGSDELLFVLRVRLSASSSTEVVIQSAELAGSWHGALGGLPARTTWIDLPSRLVELGVRARRQFADAVEDLQRCVLQLEVPRPWVYHSSWIDEGKLRCRFRCVVVTWPCGGERDLPNHHGVYERPGEGSNTRALEQALDPEAVIFHLRGGRRVIGIFAAPQLVAENAAVCSAAAAFQTTSCSVHFFEGPVSARVQELFVDADRLATAHLFDRLNVLRQQGRRLAVLWEDERYNDPALDTLSA
jgi:hypothetical protein